MEEKALAEDALQAYQKSRCKELGLIVFEFRLYISSHLCLIGHLCQSFQKNYAQLLNYLLKILRFQLCFLLKLYDRLQTGGCWFLLSLSESCSKADTALDYVGRADCSFYRREDYYSYRGEKVEAMKKNSLIIDSGNYNCLRLVYAEIPKVYYIELFLMEMAVLCSSTSVDYFIYRGGGWWMMIFFRCWVFFNKLIKNWSFIKNGDSLGEGNYHKISMHALIGY